jgi:uncharacterized protein (UPF0332 family)
MKEVINEIDRAEMVKYRMEKAKANKIKASTHQDTKHMLGLHFIHTGKIDGSHSALYGQLFNARMEGDYEDFIDHDAQTVANYRPRTEEFITAIEELLKQEVEAVG